MSFDLTKNFNLASELKKLDYDNDVNILMGGDGISSRRTTIQTFLLQSRITQEKQHKKFIDQILELTYQQIIKGIREAQMQLFDAIDRMNEVLRQADKQIEDINQRLQELTHRHGQLNDIIEARYFDKNTDGKYKNKALADTISAYEQQTGEKLTDDISLEMLISLLKAQQDFEKNIIIPDLEQRLVKLHTFRDGVQEKKETFEEENKRIADALEAIDADNSLNDEERRIQKAELLKRLSNAALDAQIAANSSETGYDEIIDAVQKEKCEKDNGIYIEHSTNENRELNQTALEKLQTIKPLLPFPP